MFNHRLKIIFSVFIIFFVAIVISLISYSIFNKGNYKEENSKEYKVFKDIPKKGNIYDRNSKILAQTNDVIYIYFDKNKEVFVKEGESKTNKCPLTPKTAVNLLAKIIDKNPEKLYNYIYNTPHPITYLMIDDTLDVKYEKKIKDLNYIGIDAYKEKDSKSKEKLCVYFNKKQQKFVKNVEKEEEKCPLSPKDAVNLLAKTIHKNPEALYNYIYNTPHEQTYILIAKNLDIKYEKKLNKLNYIGINKEVKSLRYYPEKTLAGRVLGCLKRDGEPYDGLEVSLNKYLKGVVGKYKAKYDNHGSPIASTRKNLIKKQEGNDVYLTLDINIQTYAENALSEMAKVFKPEKAMCVVMDPKTSEILACANYPFFDPNNVKKYSMGMCKNFAVQDPYDQGSTVKAITVSMALNEGYDIGHSFGVCDNRYFSVGKEPIKCDHAPHGSCTPKNIICQSCNAGAWYIAKKLGKRKLYQYIKDFGLIDKPCNEFTYESTGKISADPNNLDAWVPRDVASCSFGHSMTSTCLAMCNAYCIIANGGVYHTPKIIKEVRTRNGKKIKSMKKDSGKRIISEDASKQMAQCLVSCVKDEKGTGKKAAIEGIECAGKTASAQIKDNGTYKSGKYLVSFMGFAPAYNPEYVIAFTVVNPHGSSYGAQVAAPYWKLVMEKSLKYKKIL